MRTTIVAVLCRCPSSQLLNEPSFLLLYYTIGIAILTPLNFVFLRVVTMNIVIESEPSSLQE